MNEQVILEAIEEKLIATGVSEKKTLYSKAVSRRILSAIKPLLPPTDLLKVWEGDSLKMTCNDIPTSIKNIEVYIRELKS